MFSSSGNKITSYENLRPNPTSFSLGNWKPGNGGVRKN